MAYRCNRCAHQTQEAGDNTNCITYLEKPKAARTLTAFFLTSILKTHRWPGELFSAGLNLEAGQRRIKHQMKFKFVKVKCDTWQIFKALVPHGMQMEIGKKSPCRNNTETWETSPCITKNNKQNIWKKEGHWGENSRSSKIQFLKWGKHNRMETTNRDRCKNHCNMSPTDVGISGTHMGSCHIPIKVAGGSHSSSSHFLGREPRPSSWTCKWSLLFFRSALMVSAEILDVG